MCGRVTAEHTRDVGQRDSGNRAGKAVSNTGEDRRRKAAQGQTERAHRRRILRPHPGEESAHIPNGLRLGV